MPDLSAPTPNTAFTEMAPEPVVSLMATTATLEPQAPILDAVPDPMPPMPAVDALAALIARAGQIERKAEQQNSHAALAKAEAEVARRAADQAEVDFEMGDLDGPSLDAARLRAGEAEARQREMDASAETLRRAVPVAQRAAVEAISAADREKNGAARCELDAAREDYARLTPQIEKILGRLFAAAALVDEGHIWRSVAGRIPAEMSGNPISIQPMPPNDPKLDALNGANRLLNEAKRIRDRMERRQDAAEVSRRQAAA